MKVWPDFDENGDLPVGIHKAAISEVVEHFGRGSMQRQLVARRLERIYNFAKGTGHLARLLVFGSFVTAKGAPNDVDVFILMDDRFDLSEVTGRAATIFHHRAAQNWLGASVFWIREWRLSAAKTKWSMAGKSNEMDQDAELLR